MKSVKLHIFPNFSPSLFYKFPNSETENYHNFSTFLEHTVTIPIRLHTSVHTYLCLYVSLCLFVCLCTHLCVCVCVYVCLQVVKFWSALPLLLLLLLFAAVSDVLLLLVCVERKINLHSRFSFRLLLLQCLVFERVCVCLCVCVFLFSRAFFAYFIKIAFIPKSSPHFHSNFRTLKWRFSLLTTHFLSCPALFRSVWLYLALIVQIKLDLYQLWRLQRLIRYLWALSSSSPQIRVFNWERPFLWSSADGTMPYRHGCKNIAK